MGITLTYDHAEGVAAVTGLREGEWAVYSGGDGGVSGLVGFPDAAAEVNPLLTPQRLAATKFVVPNEFKYEFFGYNPNVKNAKKLFTSVIVEHFQVGSYVDVDVALGQYSTKRFYDEVESDYWNKSYFLRLRGEPISNVFGVMVGHDRFRWVVNESKVVNLQASGFAVGGIWSGGGGSAGYKAVVATHVSELELVGVDLFYSIV